jgi:glycine/D-amino acid oxidase-like deaminating enzyme
MNPKDTVYWSETASIPAAAPEPPEGDWDVAVIGSGITGLNAARELARRGARVCVLEAHSLGWGASSRNGGQALTGLKVGAGELIGRYGRELTRRMFAASVQAIALVEQVVQQFDIACDFARAGHLELASKPGHVRGLEHSVEVMAREFNHAVRIVARNDLPAEVGSEVYHGGLVDEASARLNPAQFTAGLARAAQQCRAVLFDHSPVERLVREGSRYRLVTARGSVRADKVFVATSGYTGGATPALQRKIVPIGSYIIATEPLPAEVATALLPRNRVVFDTKNFLHYYRLSADRRLLFGGRAAFQPETPAIVRESAAILRRDMARVFPQLRNARVEFVWGGTLDFAFDMMPHAGQHDGLYFALGYAGHGVALATYLGAQMAAAMGGEAVDNPFTEIPFPGAPLGLYDGRPWFLPFAEKWYQFLDWVT